MKRLITFSLISFIAVLLSCTSKDNSKKEQESKTTIKEKKEETGIKKSVINSETPLKLNLDNKLINGKVYFYGNTNLPDNTKLGISVKNEKGYHAQDFDIIVTNGKFESTGFTDKGEQLSGTYQVKLISHLNEFWQSKDLLKQLQYFTGSNIQKKEDKRIITLEKSFEIGDNKSNSDKNTQSNFENIKQELIGKKYTYPFSFKVVIKKYGQPETISESTTNEKWVAYFPKGDFTLVTNKSTNKIIGVYKGKQINP